MILVQYESDRINNSASHARNPAVRDWLSSWGWIWDKMQPYHFFELSLDRDGRVFRLLIRENKTLTRFTFGVDMVPNLAKQVSQVPDGLSLTLRFEEGHQPKKVRLPAWAVPLFKEGLLAAASLIFMSFPAEMILNSVSDALEKGQLYWDGRTY